MIPYAFDEDASRRSSEIVREIQGIQSHECLVPCSIRQELEHRIETNTRELSLLFEISLLLNSSRDLNSTFREILALLADRSGLQRSMLSILNRQSGEIVVQEAHGLTEQEKAKGIYQLGEGVIGKAVESGRPFVVPRISQEPQFLDKTGARKGLGARDIGFICVPIRHGDQIMGALSADQEAQAEHRQEATARFLLVVGNMIARKVKAKQQEAEELESLRQENRRLNHELQDRFRPSNIIGSSRCMQEVYRLIGQVAASKATVLIRGDNGVGKELVAQAIHFSSPRASGPFIRINCGAFPDSLVESELFGHEKGAFTGADRRREGRFELAQGGTLFLDEIGELSPSAQVKLLRVLQDKRFERLGGVQTLESDVRVIAATNRNLEEAIASGAFREDLFYRIHVFPIYVPSLRDRKSDIPALVDHFIERWNANNGGGIRRISTPAIDMLMSYHWPGNVRELENCLERAAILCGGEGSISAHHLPPTLQTPNSSHTGRKSGLEETVTNLEIDCISDALKTHGGNAAAAARALGLTERKLGLRLKKYDIDARLFAV